MKISINIRKRESRKKTKIITINAHTYRIHGGIKNPQKRN